jgi:hypothetical protein
VWRAHPGEGCYDTRWLTGLWSTQAKVEGTVPRAAWHWGREGSAVKIHFGNHAAPHCVRGAPWTVTCFISPFRKRALFFEGGGNLADVNE